jgi:hypothetical protein
MIVKDIEFESKKLADLDKIIRDKSMRLSTGGAFSARDFPIGPTDHTINHGSLQPEPRIFENSRAPDLRLPRMIDDEFDSAQVNIKYPEK